MIEKYIQIDKRRNQSIQEQLKHELYSVIMVRTLPDDYVMPSVKDLAKVLDVHSEDVQYAYDALVTEKFLILGSKGYSIRQSILPVNHGISLKALIDGITNIGLTPIIQDIEQNIVELSDLKKVDHRFDEDDKLVKFSRLYLGNEHKIAFLDNSLSIKYFPGMENINFTNFQIYPYIFEKYPDSYDIKRQFTIESINKDIASILDLAEGSPAIHIISQIYNEKGSQVEYSNIWVSAHFFKFKVSADFSL
jgi:DNA-binding GntR family transcriptional regulator